METEKTWIVTVSHTHIEQISTVATSLEGIGVHVQQILGTLGQIIGQAPEQQVDAMRHIEGVRSVDSEQGFHIL